MKLDAIMTSTSSTAKKLDKLQEDMAEMKTQNTAAMERLAEVEKEWTGSRPTSANSIRSTENICRTSERARKKYS